MSATSFLLYGGLCSVVLGLTAGSSDTTDIGTSVIVATQGSSTYYVPPMTGSYRSFVATATHVPAFLQCSILHGSGYSSEYCMATAGGFNQAAASFLAGELNSNGFFKSGLASIQSAVDYGENMKLVTDAAGAARLWQDMATSLTNTGHKQALQTVASVALELQYD